MIKHFILFLLMLAAVLMVSCGIGPTKAGTETTDEFTVAAVKGSVKDSVGVKVANANIYVRKKGYLASLDGMGWKLDGQTDADGNFKIDSLEAGSYVIEVMDQDSTGAVYRLDVDTTKKEIEIPELNLKEMATVQGHVEMANGSAAYIQVEGLERLVQVDSTTGNFEIKVPAGVFTIHILSIDTDGSKIHVKEIKADPGQYVEVGGIIPGGIVNPEDKVLKGKLFDDLGDPANSVIVTLIPNGFNPITDELSDSLIHITNNLGEFSFAGVDTGEYSLEAVHLTHGDKVLIPRVFIFSDTTIVPTDTLKATGSFEINLEELNLNIGGYVYIPGTQIFTPIQQEEIDSKKVKLIELPTGSYSSWCYTADAAQTNPECNDELIDITPLGTFVIGPFHYWQKSTRVMLTLTYMNLKEHLFNIPVLIRLNNSNFNFSEADVGGSDIRFSKMDGQTSLKFEIGSWDATNEIADIWVKYDTVFSKTESQFIQMHWGRDSTSTKSNSKVVFDTAAGYEGVWHLNDPGNNAEKGYFESTFHQLHGTGSGFSSADQLPGVIGTGRDFDGVDDKIKVRYAEFNMQSRGDFTVSAFAKYYGLQRDQQIFRKNKFYYRFELQFGGAHVNVQAAHDSLSYLIESSDTVANDEWHHIAAKKEGTTVSFYLNGVKVGVQSEGGFTNSLMGEHLEDEVLSIGYDHYNDNFDFLDGMVDELRVSSVSRSDSWIKFCYENQKLGSTVVKIE